MQRNETHKREKYKRTSEGEGEKVQEKGGKRSGLKSILVLACRDFQTEGDFPAVFVSQSKAALYILFILFLSQVLHLSYCPIHYAVDKSCGIV